MGRKSFVEALFDEPFKTISKSGVMLVVDLGLNPGKTKHPLA